VRGEAGVDLDFVLDVVYLNQLVEAGRESVHEARGLHKLFVFEQDLVVVHFEGLGDGFNQVDDHVHIRLQRPQLLVGQRLVCLDDGGVPDHRVLDVVEDLQHFRVLLVQLVLEPCIDFLPVQQHGEGHYEQHQRHQQGPTPGRQQSSQHPAQQAQEGCHLGQALIELWLHWRQQSQHQVVLGVEQKEMQCEDTQHQVLVPPFPARLCVCLLVNSETPHSDQQSQGIVAGQGDLQLLIRFRKRAGSRAVW